jgi:NADH-quinone oxidoreductase subunit G
LTSKDFRFRQRVWFLKEADTICNGCSTGCNVKVSYNREGVFRLKPVFNKDVNGHWMCDDGRDVYKQVNRASRLLDAKVFKAGVEENLVPLLAARKVGETLRSEAAAKPGSVALVLTAQHSVEEYERIVSFFKADLKSAGVYTWTNNPESFDDFDGLLIRGDKNPNTKGLKEVLAKHGVATAWSELEAGLKSGSVETVVVAGPENLEVYPDLLAKIGLLSSAKRLIWATSARVEALEKLANVTLIPLKTYMEKSGTFVNHAGLRQQVKKVLTVVPNALSLVELTNAFAGQDVRYESADDVIGQGRVNNIATAQRGAL